MYFQGLTLSYKTRKLVYESDVWRNVPKRSMKISRIKDYQYSHFSRTSWWPLGCKRGSYWGGVDLVICQEVQCGWYDLPHDFSEPLVWGVWIKKSCMMNFIDQKQQFSQNIIWKLNLIIFKTSEILQNSIKLNHWSDLTEFLRSAQSQVKVKF